MARNFNQKIFETRYGRASVEDWTLQWHADVLELAQPDPKVELRAVKGGELIGLIGVIGTAVLLLGAARHCALRLKVVSE